MKKLIKPIADTQPMVSTLPLNTGFKKGLSYYTVRLTNTQNAFQNTPFCGMSRLSGHRRCPFSDAGHANEQLPEGISPRGHCTVDEHAEAAA